MPSLERMRLLQALVLCSVLGPFAARAGEPVDWPQSRRSASNDASLIIDAVASGTPRPWTFDGSGRTWGYEPGMTVWSSPAVGKVGERAVVMVGSYDHDLYCLDAATGALSFKLTTGGRVAATPTLWTDGDRSWLYVASSDRLLYALDATNGRQRWVHAVETYRPTLGGAHLSSPVVGQAGKEAAVFVSHWIWDRSLAGSMQEGRLSAFDAREGRPLWTTALGDNELTAPIFVPFGGSGWLFVGSAGGALTALDAETGQARWRHVELDAIEASPALAELPGARLLILGSKYGALRALDATTGEVRWSFKTGDRITAAPLVFFDGSRVLVIAGSYDGWLYALDAATGQLSWRYGAGAGIYSSAAVAFPAGEATILVSAWDHALHAVSARDGKLRFATFTGRPLWAVAGLDASLWSSPAAARINGQWTAFVGSYDGTLRALPLDEAARLPAPIRSNALFWWSFPVTLVPVVVLAIVLTRRERRRRLAQRPGAPP